MNWRAIFAAPRIPILRGPAGGVVTGALRMTAMVLARERARAKKAVGLVAGTWPRCRPCGKTLRDCE
jgi:hypothetical protein